MLVALSGCDRGAGPSEAQPPPEPEPQILFGDLHVHTTYSWDSFLFSLPISGGEGAHPPDDACDFARYCASLDFFAITDHAESLLPEHWEASKESVRRCNARAGDERDPDIVAFMGFEWSQTAATPEEHWGHRCVIYPGTADEELPARPIGAVDRGPTFERMAAGMRVTSESLDEPASVTGFAEYLESLSALPICESGTDSRSLPATCRELAATPGELNEKLGQWGLEALVIPHGTAWGLYTPATTSMAKQLTPEHYDPRRERLIEVMSGHGSSEEYRELYEFEVQSDGTRVCKRPGPDYLPCCWQAGKLTRRYCEEPSSAECEAAAQAAMQQVVDDWDIGAHRAVPQASAEEWLDCGQCRNCFKPGISPRPQSTVQYALALSHPTAVAPDGRPLRFRHGFIASSDGHSGRPGTGYKQVERMGMMTDANPPPATEELAELRRRALGPVDERLQSFLFPGGLVAVHAVGRDRNAIWKALQRREVYGTSGPRIQLWFDLVNGPEGRVPMGGEATLAGAPIFEVRAVGSLVQRPGCPDWGPQGLSPERRSYLCRDECYNPAIARHRIEMIEVVRIRPQRDPHEPIGPLIEDPWRVLPCPDDPLGCVVRFEDPDHAIARRDALYYVRALERRRKVINGQPLATRFDSFRQALSTEPCAGGPDSDDPNCLSMARERAWSSPIYVNHRGSRRR